MLFQLRWLIGASAASFVLALISNQILKAIGDEIGVQTHHARGGIFGAVMGIGTGVLGTPRAKKSVQDLRERLFSTGKSK